MSRRGWYQCKETGAVWWSDALQKRPECRGFSDCRGRKSCVVGPFFDCPDLEGWLARFCKADMAVESGAVARSHPPLNLLPPKRCAMEAEPGQSTCGRHAWLRDDSIGKTARHYRGMLR